VEISGKTSPFQSPQLADSHCCLLHSNLGTRCAI